MHLFGERVNYNIRSLALVKRRPELCAIFTKRNNILCKHRKFNLNWLTDRKSRENQQLEYFET